MFLRWSLCQLYTNHKICTIPFGNGWELSIVTMTREHQDHLADGGKDAKHASMNVLESHTQGKVTLPEIWSAPSGIIAPGLRKLKSKPLCCPQTYQPDIKASVSNYHMSPLPHPTRLNLKRY